MHIKLSNPLILELIAFRNKNKPVVTAINSKTDLLRQEHMVLIKKKY